ncbi:DUF6343 family protein [Motilibacter deserti]|uniref:Uncharacterized protein n=1 Tax=Motilibacter deserti TaxID=2714956 RepID=A0ABX0H1V8_9ACTN|nr:DUF6343 family protein [Motilibacter deserti]NHC16326.1 hypothetical protein [Motilibacter deserti]
MTRRERVGDEPATARTALGLRAALAAFGLVLCGGFAVATFVSASGRDDPGGLWAFFGVLVVLALVALVDLVVLVRRIADEQRPLA